MRLILVLTGLTVVVLGMAACGRGAPNANGEGNEAFAEGDFDTALGAYRRAQDKAPELAEPHYNSGNTHYRQQEYEDAQKSYNQALLTADEGLTRNGTFNMGNTFFSAEQYDKAIDAYKDALRLDPKDRDAKHNLEIALRRLHQQEQPSQRSDQTGEEQEEKRQDQGEENEDDSTGESEDQPQPQPDQQERDQQPDGQTSPPQEQRLTEEQARRLLESVSDDTETLQEHLQQVFVAPGVPPAQDW